MYGSLDISTSGMIAQRIRLEAISANLANKDAILNSKGEYDPFRRREVMFAAGNPGASTPGGQEMGVHVSEIFVNQDALREQFAPGSPYDDDKDGYILVPDIDPVTEQVNAMEAMRAYEANVAAAQATKTMMAQALRLLA